MTVNDPTEQREPATSFKWVIVAAVVVWGLGASIIVWSRYTSQ